MRFSYAPGMCSQACSTCRIGGTGRPKLTERDGGRVAQSHTVVVLRLLVDVS